MKKLLCLLGASLLLTSCFNDDILTDPTDPNPSDPSSSNLIKEIVTTYDSEYYTSTIIYDGDKIVSAIDSDGFKINYTYTGDKITKEEYFDNEAISSTIEYTYTNGKLATSIEKSVDNTYDYKIVYTHNNDGTVSYAEFNLNKETGEIVDNGDKTSTYTYSGGNLVKKVQTYSGYEYTDTYEYDTKNNAIHNITGYSLLLNNEEFNSVNNVVKKTSSGSIETYTYKYNANGFPTEKQSFYNGEADGTFQYAY